MGGFFCGRRCDVTWKIGVSGFGMCGVMKGKW